ncbi:hypothetical protein CHL76_00750 [Marinococcus halophilus]|uniref:hypothetical protein n=1 Tax=Marinococcus halophilus TaxID=1371 RepID=UPI000BA06B89|nr:hypothetical protein [Marinococcus halophilus]OZT81657.1 hypothetical protein CHL76_00750 [Marinococcus halophilus]
MQTKIMSLVVGLVAFITISSFGVFAYLEYNDIEEELEDKALSTATYIASSPVVQGAYASEDPSSVLQPGHDYRQRRLNGLFHPADFPRHDDCRSSFLSCANHSPEKNNFSMKKPGAPGFFCVIFAFYPLFTPCGSFSCLPQGFISLTILKIKLTNG